MILIHICLEQSYSTSRKLENSNKFQIVITLIVFMAVIIVNGYKGLVITHLVAPSPLPELKSITFIPNDKD